ncbi:glycosyltransferase family 2 protein [Leptotrichia buccalis]|uniref:Glycosyl transferase family 2 n=1 Tax=Leptotrichia buccalis (strain ATCC 14201 / DSM 1135 / JCM 12969 / NCTC 10249 / C-1013-b) TaxID=523794 RepID=C7NDQ7_LEPBD|nr:glycosyltransferase family 2 protein [Leptotrichia buccalis]ACV40021.1 glycosyl transferase family 2 [Leptotrichia buccalis C-1013-b]
MYDFTACIVTYNTEQEELNRILNCFKKIKLKFKLWISDNSEKDILRNFIENFSDDRIKYIFNNSNKGFGAGHNIVLQKLIEENEKSEFHLMINADVFFEENTIEKIIAYMRKNSDIGQIGPRIYESNGEINRSCRLLPTPLNLIFRRFFPVKSIVEKMDYSYEMKWYNYKSIIEVPILSGCFIFVRTDILKDIGVFDERYFMYMEDYDLCRRIGKKYKVVFYPKVNIVHKHGKASYKSRKMMIIHIKSAIKYFNKWGWIFDKERKIKNRKCIQEYNK